MLKPEPATTDAIRARSALIRKDRYSYCLGSSPEHVMKLHPDAADLKGIRNVDC
jgi:hypothetical protein